MLCFAPSGLVGLLFRLGICQLHRVLPWGCFPQNPLPHPKLLRTHRIHWLLWRIIPDSKSIPLLGHLALWGWGYADFHVGVNFRFTAFSEVRLLRGHALRCGSWHHTYRWEGF